MRRRAREGAFTCVQSLGSGHIPPFLCIFRPTVFLFRHPLPMLASKLFVELLGTFVFISVIFRYASISAIETTPSWLRSMVANSTICS